jgi:FKBP-type peptidyl-prolyl cis-trans isomerase SlyD
MKPQVVSFHYTLRDKAGQVLDASQEDSPIIFLEGSGQIIEGLESSLQDLPLNEKREVIVEAEQAYGVRDESLIRQVDRAALPVEEIAIGDMFQTGQDRHSPIVRVVSIEGDQVTLDANHPLAGSDLFFDVEVVDRRDATDEEIDHGHVHGPGGHHHH